MTSPDSDQNQKWEEKLRGWAKPANEQQEARADRTAAEVRDGLSEYAAIPNSAMRVFAQGSKRNNTDVPGDCDVDIAVELQQGHVYASDQPDVFVFGVAKSASRMVTKEALGLTDVPRVRQPDEFKQHVFNAMVAAFDARQVSRHDKCIKVDSTRLTIPADVVACYPYRHYVSATKFEPGIMIYPDSAGCSELGRGGVSGTCRLVSSGGRIANMKAMPGSDLESQSVAMRDGYARSPA